MQRDMTSFANDKYQFGDFGSIKSQSYDGKNSVDFYRAITIGGHYYNNGQNINHYMNANEWKLLPMVGIAMHSMEIFLKTV